MISKEDRMYFIDPLQPASVRKTRRDGEALPLQIVALRYRREGFKTERLGTVIDVTHQRVDNNELWWVDGDGDYVYGAQLSDRVSGHCNVMTIIDDDLFIVGRNGGDHHLGHGTILSDARRSDGKRLPGMPGNQYSHTASLAFKAADWAHELMPVNGDTPEVVAAKVARAKQRFIQRHKKGEIYKEGMRRDWLHHLESLREGHDMPEPVFAVGIEGTYLAPGGDNIAMEDLTEVQRNRIQPVTTNAVVRSDSVREGFAQSFVGRPFSVVTGLTVSDMAALGTVRSSDIKYAVYDTLRTHSGHVIEGHRFPILVSF